MLTRDAGRGTLEMFPKLNGMGLMEARVMPDTEVRGARRRMAVAFAAMALALAASSSLSAGELLPRVLWTRADHVYVALAEGGSAQEGDSVAFDDRRRHVAGGRVASIVRGEMAVVVLTSGSFERVKKLDRVRVIFTRPPLSRRSALRVALPGDGRGYLLFQCSEGAPPLPRLPEGLRGYTLREGEAHERPLRLKPDPHANPPAPWPDTLVIYYFGNAADEEIALERGDVDVAVFWPGELSRRMREDSRWLGSPLGPRSRGVLALVGPADVASDAPDSAAAAGFNDELFRGDLEPLGSGARGRGWALRIQVDASMPGAGPIGSWLARATGRSGHGRPPLARFAYVDAPSDTIPSPGFQPLFRLRCPVLSAAPVRPTVERIGAGVFADMAPCASLAPRNHR